MFQKIVDFLYRNPLSQLKTWRRFGGYLSYKKMLLAQNEMESASKKIIVKCEKNQLPPIEVCFLTGKRFWYQTVFCAYSLQKVTPNPIHFTFYDDGTLSELGNIKNQIPNSKIIYIDEIELRLKKYLPISKYPYLHHKREVYKHIRKLTDVYAGTSGWKLMLDSDMLFTQIPSELINWLKNPTIPIYMQEEITSYGYSKDVMEKLSGTIINECINVGCLGLNNSLIDWDKLELWAKTLEESHGTSYYLEQALSAMIIGDKTCLKLSKEQYVVYPKPLIDYPNAILFHFVDLSKAEYFRSAWKKI